MIPPEDLAAMRAHLGSLNNEFRGDTDRLLDELEELRVLAKELAEEVKLTLAFDLPNNLRSRDVLAKARAAGLVGE